MKSYGAWTKLFKALTSMLWILLGCAFIVGVIWFVQLLWTANQTQKESDVPTESSEAVSLGMNLGGFELVGVSISLREVNT